MDIPSSTPANMPTPSAGTVAYFFNLDDGGKLYYMTHTRAYYPASSGMQDVCSCRIGEMWMDRVSCALADSRITALEFQAIMNGGISVTTSVTDDGAGNRNSTFTISSKSNVESISLNHSTADISQNDNLQLTSTILPASAPQAVTWASSDTDVATVDSTGNVVVGNVTLGLQATIYCYSLANPSIFATCIITVVA